MSGPGADRPAGSRSDIEAGDALVRLSLRILAGYLAITLVPLARWSAAQHSWAPLIAHTAALTVALLAAAARPSETRGLRDWVPLGLGPFLYFELRWIIEAVGRPHADALVAGWESVLFSSDPSRSLAPLLPSVALSEVLHFCYLSYYALVYVPPALLWLRGRRRAFAETVLALVVVYAACFAMYALFPVDGPRFVRGPSMAQAGPIRTIVMRLLESGSSRGTAFPSSHVAASVVAALCALRHQRRTGLVVAILTVGLAIGAVYGGYHYGVDIVAGALTGLSAFAISRVLARRATLSA